MAKRENPNAGKFHFLPEVFVPTLNWLGKDAVLNHHLDVPYRTLEVKESFNCESGKSENKIIHGDNLEALKALLPEYEGRVKCIYIDPPYNTGNENWVYNDNVNSPKIKKWLGQVVGKESEDLTRHDKWLCMMYPRLKLLQKLLSEDVAIFISIDDNEQANLKLICDEIFGAGNFVAECVVQRSTNGMGDKKGFSRNHDYIICYQKSEDSDFSGLSPDENYESLFDKEDEYGKYKMDGILMKKGAGSRREDSPTLYFPLYYSKETGKVYLTKETKDLVERYPIKSDGSDGRWTWGKEKIKNENFRLYASPNGTIYIKDYLTTDRTMKLKTILSDKSYLTDRATNEIKQIFGEKSFNTPKPVTLIEHLLQIATDKSSIILDSFAGSSTTAHAVLNLNKRDGGNRKFILIEMEDYANSITAERVRRVINGYASTEGTGGDFNFYELGPEMILDDNLNESQSIENIRSFIYYTETRTPIDKEKARASKHEFFLGDFENTAYYLFYKKKEITTLDFDFLSTIQTPSERYVIYADNCVLPKDFLFEHNITFKKIPRDVRKF